MASKPRIDLKAEALVVLASEKAPNGIEAVDHRGLFEDYLDSVGRTDYTDDLSITTPKINDNAVTNGKLAQMPEFTAKANMTGATANPQDVLTEDIENAGASCFTSRVNNRTTELGGRLYRNFATVSIPESVTQSAFQGTGFVCVTGVHPQDTSSRIFPAGCLRVGNCYHVKLLFTASGTPNIKVVYNSTNLYDDDVTTGLQQLEFKLIVTAQSPTVGSIKVVPILDGKTLASNTVTSLNTQDQASLNVTFTTTGGQTVTLELSELLFMP